MRDTHKYHTVKSEDTFSGIAKEYDLKLEQLYRLNPHISNDIKNMIGKKVRVSSGELKIKTVISLPDIYSSAGGIALKTIRPLSTKTTIIKTDKEGKWEVKGLKKPNWAEVKVIEPEWGSKPGFEVHQRANREGINRKGHPNYSITNDANVRISALNKGTVFADSDQFQTGAYSFHHAMRNEKQSVQQAKVAADNFVREQLNKAKQLLLQGRIEEAYQRFALGLHTLQDATSPAHGGFQKWTGKENFGEQFNHVSKELSYPGLNSNLQKITNEYLDWFEKSTEPLPKENLFDKIKTD